MLAWVSERWRFTQLTQAEDGALKEEDIEDLREVVSDFDKLELLRTSENSLWRLLCILVNGYFYYKIVLFNRWLKGCKFGEKIGIWVIRRRMDRFRWNRLILMVERWVCFKILLKNKYQISPIFSWTSEWLLYWLPSILW